MKEISRLCWVLAALPACLFASEPDPGATGGSADEGGDGGDAGIPDLDYCDAAADWDDALATAEQEVLALVNQVRAQGATCGGMSAPPTHALVMNGALRCAARVHALDMAQRGFFDHVNPEGEDPFVRMGHAGYAYVAAGENIAGGQPDAVAAMQSWIESPGHCQNIMLQDFADLGVGYARLDGSPLVHYWVQTFGQEL